MGAAPGRPGLRPGAEREAAEPGAAMLAACMMLAVVVGTRATSRARADDDDWHVVERHEHHHSPANASTCQGAAAGQGGGQRRPCMVCGEQARPAGEPYQSIVAQLNDMWGTNFPVYESLSPGSPHASSGG